MGYITWQWKKHPIISFGIIQIMPLNVDRIVLNVIVPVRCISRFNIRILVIAWQQCVTLTDYRYYVILFLQTVLGVLSLTNRIRNDQNKSLCKTICLVISRYYSCSPVLSYDLLSYKIFTHRTKMMGYIHIWDIALSLKNIIRNDHDKSLFNMFKTWFAWCINAFFYIISRDNSCSPVLSNDLLSYKIFTHRNQMMGYHIHTRDMKEPAVWLSGNYASSQFISHNETVTFSRNDWDRGLSHDSSAVCGALEVNNTCVLMMFLYYTSTRIKSALESVFLPVNAVCYRMG